jgi:hypothetical protein
LVGENGDGRVVGDGRFVGDMVVLDYSAMAVIGVFAETDVRDYEELEIGFADGFDGALDYSLRGEGDCAARLFRFRQA